MERASKVRITCNNGANGDEVCDWAVLKATQEDSGAASTENKTDVQNGITVDFK
jgi:hypothetical protein